MPRAEVDPEFWMDLPPKPVVAATYIPSNLHAKQLQFVALTQLEAMFGGAAGGGKTEAILADALQYVDRPSYSAIVFRRTFKALSLRGSVMNRALEWLGRDLWHEQDKQFRFPSGATLQFGYCDSAGDLERYKSAQFHRCYIDELTEWPEAWYTFLFSRLRRTVGDDIPIGMRSATNPDGLGAEWVRRRFGIPEGQIVHDPILDAAEDRCFLPARAEDNPSLDLVEYERALAKLGAAKFQQLRWGRWIRDGEGLVYARFDKGKHVIEATPRSLGLTQYVLGIDYGYTDATALTVVGWRPHDPCAYIVESFKETGLTPSGAAEKVQELQKGYEFQRIVGDIGGLGKGYAEEARTRFHLPIEPAEKANKRGYIDLLNGALADGQLRLLAATTGELQREWAELPWTEDRAKEADGFDNHCSDSALYAWRACLAFVEKPQPAPPTDAEKVAAEAEAIRERRRRETERSVEGGGTFADRWRARAREGTSRWGR